MDAAAGLADYSPEPPCNPGDFFQALYDVR